MKKNVILLIFAFFSLAVGSLSAQKVALVDMQYILGKIPAYQMMNKQVESLTNKWQKEVKQVEKQAQSLYEKYQKEQVFLSDEQKKAKEEEIVSKEKEAYTLKHKYFGPKGELFKKREELMKPIRKEVWKSLKKLASKRGYQIIMDKETSKIVYADPTVDLSKQVLAELGFE